MIPSLTKAAWIAPALLLTGLGASSDTSLKCASQHEPLYAVDGEIKGSHSDFASRNFKRDEILWLQVVCMDPHDSTFRRGAGIPVLSVWTIHGPAAHLEPTLAAILDAQDARARRGLAYTSDPEALGLPARPATLTLSLDVHEGGWLATAEVDRLLAKCFVFDGDVATPHPLVAPQQPQCVREGGSE